jgi:hypothetical protein
LFDETDEFLEHWSMAEHCHEEAERARRLGLFIDLEGDGNTDLSSSRLDAATPARAAAAATTRRRIRSPTTTRKRTTRH